MIINLFPNVHLLFTDCILVIKQMKNLMCIHADDYGYSQNISKDILFCIDNGLVNSVSVMIHADEKSLDNLIEKKLLKVSIIASIILIIFAYFVYKFLTIYFI